MNAHSPNFHVTIYIPDKLNAISLLPKRICNLSIYRLTTFCLPVSLLLVDFFFAEDWRLCEDYCALNSIQVTDQYPSHTHTHKTIISLHNSTISTIFSKIDLVQAYHKILVEQSDVATQD